MTTDDIGKFVQTDGSISSTATASSVAMIAYVGNNSACDHGVAISLVDGDQGDWSDNATTWADGHVISNTPSGSTWRVPSQNDIEKMYTACNSSTTSLNGRLKAGSASYGFTETGGSPTWYWTSTVSDYSASIFKDNAESPSSPNWDANSTGDGGAVNSFRYVFAF